ncbi:MAG: ABC transporter ATP-binding protein [Oscillospiraceae bacterium]|nr:ABC transporter ATP-binding protein [Oscillospiraceae bacterium]
MRRITLRDLGIRFRYPMDRTRTLKAKIKSAGKRIFLGKKPRHFDALKHINMTIEDGEIVGFIGPNGSGKTTLLRAVSGIYTPDSGSVEVNGCISSLLSLGTGFNQELNGLENIRLNALLMGMSNKEIDARMPEIIDFTDIGDHIYSPMKYYSSGMISRLSFSIVLAMRPDILLIDEIFSVGDLNFQKKSQRAMKELLERAACQLIVTHSLSLVKNHCTRAVFIKNGSIVADGNPDDVVELYEKDSAAK